MAVNIYSTTTSMERYIMGTEKVLNNLAKELNKIKDRISKKGMWTVLLLLKGKAIPLTPVEYGNLYNSYSTYVFDGLNGVEGYLVNSAGYALFVHEMPETYNFTKPGTGPKFVERPLKENTQLILRTLRDSARIR